MSADEEDKEDRAADNKKRMLLALAVMLGSSADSYKDIPAKVLAQAKALYKQRNMQIDVEQEARMPEREVQIKVAELGDSADVELYKIVGTEDERTCEDCSRWQGKVVAMHEDGEHETVQDFINDHGFHYGCRCSLQPLDTTEIQRKYLLKQAHNCAYDMRKACFS